LCVLTRQPEYSPEAFIALQRQLAEQQQQLDLAEQSASILADENDRLERTNRDLALRLELATAKLAQLRAERFGARNERFENADQIALPIIGGASEETTARVVAELERVEGYLRKKTPKKHPGRNELPPELPRVTIEIEPDEDVTGLRRIGAEITEELVTVPASVYVRQYIRYKYASAEDEDGRVRIIIGQLPSRLLDKCIASDETLATLVVDKHVDHLPIYRQLKRYERLGITLAEPTVDSWQRELGLRLRPLYEAHRGALFDASYWQIDESTIRVQDRSKKGKTHQGFLWVYHDPLRHVVYFEYRRGRGRDDSRAMLDGFGGGYAQTDGYAVYEKFKERTDVIALACWAHARRKFKQALGNDKERSELALAMIQRLYAVEREAREQSLSHEERGVLRIERSEPVLALLREWLLSQRDEVAPRSLIGKAISYTLSLWAELTNYLLDGRLEIDNNWIENAIRPLALGRKNYLFAGSGEGAINVAMYRSFFGTCAMHGIDPYRWLLAVLTHLPTTPPERYHTLLPQNIDRALMSSSIEASLPETSTDPS
jgi:transposase